MKIGTKECRKCGRSLTGSNRFYRVRVKLPSGKWKSKTVPRLNMANKIELQYKTKGVEEDIKIQFEIMTITEVWPEYLKWAKQNKKSWHDDAARYHNHIEKHISGYKLDRVIPHHVQAIINTMYTRMTPRGKPYAPATIKQVLVLVKRIFNWSIKQGYYIGTNPYNSIEMPRFDNSVTNPLPVDALAHIISGAANEAAFWAARADNPETALSQAQTAMAELIRSLKT